MPSDGSRGSQRWGLTILLLALPLLIVYFSSGGTYGSTKLWSTPLSSRLSYRSHVAVTRSSALRPDVARPPQAPRVYTDTPDTLKKLVADLSEKEKSLVQDIIRNVKPEEATFHNTVLPYIQHENEVSIELGVVGVYMYLSPQKELQSTAQELSSNLSAISQATYLNEEFFARVNTTYQQANDTGLDAESQKLLFNFWNDFRGAGLAVPKGENRERYRNITNELVTVINQYNEANVDDQTALWFTREELNGTKEVTLSALEKGTGEHEGKLKLELKSNSDTNAVMAYCTNETTRQTIYTTIDNRTPDNVAKLKKAIALRDESARLLGAPNFAADRIQNNTMAGSPEAVHKLLDHVQERIRPTANDKTAHLTALKQADTETTDPLFMWDIAHYQTLSNEREYNANREKIREYFPSEPTMREILQIYAEVYLLQFVKIEGKDADELSPTGKKEDLTYLHPDVELYAVWDDPAWSTHRKRSDEDFVGYLYLDMYQRDGKVGGAYMMPIESGFERADGGRHFPTCIMATNFKKSRNDAPSLLYRSELQTIFHELGHAMHQLTSRVAYKRWHGPGGCPADFFEAPSQMMENWSYEPQVLKRLGKHWSYLSDDARAEWKKQQNDSDAEQPPEQMPDDMIAGIRNARNAYSSNAELGQVFYASYDLALHEPATHQDAEAMNTSALYFQLEKNITGHSALDGLPKGYQAGHPEASVFTHSMLGYEANYYAYHWSRVYSKDLFYTAFKQDPLSSAQGRRFREIVLEPGGSKDFKEILTEFLGHEPSEHAYFDDLELDKQ